MRLISQGNQRYESEDGRVLVEWQGGFMTDCDEPHPMRVRVEEFNSWSEHYKRAVLSLGAHEKGRFMVWLCPGNEEHEYGQWVSQVDGTWTEFVTDKFEHQIGDLTELLGEEIKVVRPRKPKPEPLVNPCLELALEIWQDELRAINEALARYEELMDSDDAEFVDQKLHDFHLKRKAELEGLLA